VSHLCLDLGTQHLLHGRDGDHARHRCLCRSARRQEAHPRLVTLGGVLSTAALALAEPGAVVTAMLLIIV
jgi:hypothetical protein